MGFAFCKPKPWHQREKWPRISKKAIADVLRIYSIVIPPFLLSSL